MKDLSIVIVNYNNAKLLEACLKSVQNFSQKLALEIIVSDNGSSDGSQKMLKDKFPEVTLIENNENLGFIKATNKGLKIASGRYIILLNDDTELKNNALEILVDFMDKNPKIGACGPKLLNTDNTPQRQGSILGNPFWKRDEAIPVDFVIGGALLLRKEVFQQIGLMDENLFFYNDDIDWCKSIRKAGWQIYFVPQALIMHYGGYSSRRTFNRRLFVEGFRGGLYFCRKHYNMVAYLAYRLLLLILLPIPILVFTLLLPFNLKINRQKLLAYKQIFIIALFNQVPKPERKKEK